MLLLFSLASPRRPERKHHLSVTFTTRQRKSAIVLQSVVRTHQQKQLYATLNAAAMER